MTRLRVWIALALGLGLGAVAYRWAAHDRPFDAPRARRSRDAGVATRAPVAPVVAATAPRGPTLPIAVIDARAGTALADVTLTLRRADGGGAIVVLTATTDPLGRAALALGEGRWQVAATRGGAPLVLTDAEDWTVGAALDPELIVRAVPAAEVPPPRELPPVPPGAGALVGEVTLAGARPADLIVTPIFLGDFGPGHPVVRDRVPQPTPLPPRRFVGTGGSFRWDGLAPGSYAVLVVAPDRGVALVRAMVTADLAGNASSALAPAAGVAGRALDDRGAELAGVEIVVWVGDLRLAAVTTDAHGTFLVPDLPAGPAKLVASRPGCIGDRPTLTLVAGQRAMQPLGLLCGDAAGP
ncbi:MAG: carboxypeptidase regulatory-like domain-containing protein [Myxococcales bacterium]|nr:carboxypeptidase regulatory-like domain-containing protein [Myxococcales bacterium]